jgi:hypothetical protein
VITSGAAPAGTVINSTSLIRVPAGPASLLLANAGPAGTVYAGAGTNVTTAGGFPIPSGLVPPVVVPLYAGAPAGTWSVLCAAGGSASVAWIVSAPSGGTGI